MYYFLGHKLTRNLVIPPEGDDKLELRLQMRAENTFLMALDGDIDFEPSALIVLIDLMTRNPQLGAACGRIHPTGSGKQNRAVEFLFRNVNMLCHKNCSISDCV
jgi:chitin synthase